MATPGNTALQLGGVQQLQQKLLALGARFPAVVTSALEEVGHMARSHMQEEYLTSGPLRVRSGQLRRNWQVRKVNGAEGMAVQVSTNTKYARVHNYGFHGSVYVREHVRKRRGGAKAKSSRGATGRGGRVRGWNARLLVRGEARRKAADTQRREAGSRAAHGMGVREKQAQSRMARRARGLQGGVEASTGKLDAKAAQAGAVVVRAHGRYMKVRGHLYVERTLRDVERRAQALLQDRLRRAIERL